MPGRPPAPLACLLSVPLLLLGAPGAYGQSDPPADLRLYEGPYRIGGYAGRAEFQYTLDDDGDTTLSGGFRMTGSDLASLLGAGDNYFAFRGTFRDDVPTERWRLGFGEYTADGSASVQGYEYHVDVDGTLREASGSLRRGRLDSRWKAEVRRVRHSAVAATPFRSEVTFSAGVPQQTFRLEGGRATLLGRFKRDGFAHDAWSLYTDTDALAEWRFDNGWLRAVGRDGGEEVVVFGPDLTAGAVVELDARYLRLVGLYQRLHGRPADFTRGRAADLLRTNAGIYADVSGVLAEVGGTQDEPLFKVRVPYRALTGAEVARLDSIRGRLERVDEIRSALASTTSLRIAETTDEQVAYLRALIAGIDDELLAPVRALDSVYRDGLLEYLPRDRYLAMLYPGGQASLSLDVEFDGQAGQESRPFPGGPAPTYAVGTEGLEAVSALSAAALAAVDSARRALGVRLVTGERQQVLTALDRQLMVDFNRLDSLVDAQADILPENYGLAEVREVARAQLRTYADLDNALAQRASVEELIACIADLNALAITLTRLPERAAEIEELYVDEVWNNITATVMEETVKRRLLEAYDDKLVPYFLQEVRTSLDCDNAARIGGQLEALNARMVELRAAETERLEQRVKRADNPRRLLALLEIAPES